MFFRLFNHENILKDPEYLLSPSSFSAVKTKYPNKSGKTRSEHWHTLTYHSCNLAELTLYVLLLSIYSTSQ